MLRSFASLTIYSTCLRTIHGETTCYAGSRSLCAFLGLLLQAAAVVSIDHTIVTQNIDSEHGGNLILSGLEQTRYEISLVLEFA